MSVIDPLQMHIFVLPCAECGKVSHKSFLDLEMENRLPCDHCGVSISVTDYYGKADLEAFLQGLGRSGFILRDRHKGN